MQALFAETNEPRTSYVYGHWRPDKNVCFYIGKGSRGRAHVFSKRNAHHENVVKKLKAMGIEPEVRILKDKLTNKDALAIEIQTIAVFRALGHPLTNMTAGGEGMTGYKPTPETLEKRSKSLKGRTFSPEAIEKLRKASTGQVKSPEARDKMRKARAGYKPSVEQREKQSATMKERYKDPDFKNMMMGSQTKGPMPQGTKDKISKANKGKKHGPLSDEAKERLRVSSSKIVLTPEQRAKISLAKKGVPTGIKQTPETIEARVAGLRKRVFCNETGVTYPSITDAAIATGANKSHIGSVCNGKRKTAGGYTFRYTDG